MKSQSLPVPPGMVQQFHCAFFNFTAEEGNQTGGWSYRGVKTHVINTTHVRCIASHLTSFVVLVSIVPSVGEPVSGDIVLYKLLLYYINYYILYIVANCDIAKGIYMLIPTYINILCSISPPFSLTSACSGLHHIHWLQHFITVFACLHYILLNTEVSPKIYCR